MGDSDNIETDSKAIELRNRGESHNSSKNFVKKRSCTDLLCAFLFLLFLIGWFLVFFYAFHRSDMSILLNPADSEGRKCGRDQGVETRPYLYYYNLLDCVPHFFFFGCSVRRMCISECPTVTERLTAAKIMECSGETREKLLCGPDRNSSYGSCLDLVKGGYCYELRIKSVPIHKLCLPVLLDRKWANSSVLNSIPAAANITRFANKINSFDEFGMMAVDSYRSSWWLIVLSLVASMVVSFLLLLMLRFTASLMLAVTMLGSLAAIVYGCYYTFLRYHQLDGVYGSDQILNPLNVFIDGLDAFMELRITWLSFFIVLTIVGILLFFILCVLLKRMRFAVQLIEISTRAVAAAPSVLFFPLVPWLLQVLCILFFAMSALLIMSMTASVFKVTKLPDQCTAGCNQFTLNGTCVPSTFSELCQSSCPQAECSLVSNMRSALIPYLQSYNLLAVIWVMLFLSAYGDMTVAGVFVAWYWTFDKRQFSRGRSLFSSRVLESSNRALRYHIGTMAFGSLLVALVRFVRVILTFVKKKCNQYPNVKLARCVLYSCSCCLWCLDKFLRIINRNAYIMCAINGDGFCTAARKGFSLIMGNVLLVATIDAVCDFIFFLTRVLVAIGVALGAFYFLESDAVALYLDLILPEVQHRWIPLLTIALGSYFIAGVFISVYSIGIDTIFICFYEDYKQNDGSKERPYYMPHKLMKVMTK